MGGKDCERFVIMQVKHNTRVTKGEYDDGLY